MPLFLQAHRNKEEEETAGDRVGSANYSRNMREPAYLWSGLREGTSSALPQLVG